MATMKLVLVLMMASVVAVCARDPELTTDFAVPVGMNSSLITGDFFTFTGLRNFSAAPNTFGSKKVTQVEFPALTGLGVGVTLLEYKPNTLNPPHTHPRGSELIFVMAGHLDVGLIDSANKLYAAHLHEGDLFVFPQGLVHFQINMSKEKSVLAISAFGSSNAGTISMPRNIFGSGDDAISSVGTIGDGMMFPTSPSSNSRRITGIGDSTGSQFRNDPSLPETYHFQGTTNYLVSYFRIQHALTSSSLFDSCILRPSFLASLY
ncbi:hypothetical protein AXG93_1953s1230 [Marchantia polymorpha subsp. ruderalis]|uniref:Germin-like protein n=1 Tax=Marchantia polymorpha subsp. ruderalis TaxID=1480154 RepID=A0A176VRY0_MARPO|nr:hypothetical protein AXG93_1953s1230 [Marchantia polymorpha subsp. ruderalis]